MKYVDSDREQVALAEEGNGKIASAHCGNQRALITHRGTCSTVENTDLQNLRMVLLGNVKRQRSNGEIETLCKIFEEGTVSLFFFRRDLSWFRCARCYTRVVEVFIPTFLQVGRS